MKSGNYVFTGNGYINHSFVVHGDNKELNDGRITINISRCIFTKQMYLEINMKQQWYTSYTYYQKDKENIVGILNELRNKIQIYLNMSKV